VINYKENLFKLIREEKVIIFAGAGMSIYAGYPSGKKLSEIFYSELTTSEREHISPNLNLPDITEELFRFRNNNKNELIRTINKVFSAEPSKDPKIHSLLASIPHFKTIITTNYDNLLETSYGNKAQKIYSEHHLPLIDNKKTQIFKIHGDLLEPDSIILTRSDYNNFFKTESQNNSLWTIIKERFITNNILFVGYNLEDPNISVLFENISDNLKDFRKEAYLLAPNLPPQKISHLTHQKINYINSDAESFFEELILELKNNVIGDLEDGKISADTFKEFLINQDLLPELDGKLDSYKLKSLKGLNGKIEGKIKFTFNNQDEIVNDFRDFIDGKKFGEFELTEKDLASLDMGWGGIRFPEMKDGYKLKIIDRPRFDTKVDIKFQDKFLYDDLKVKGYGSQHNIEIQINFNFADITLSIDPETFPDPQCNFVFDHHRNCGKIHEEIKLFELLKRFCLGQKFTIFNNSKLVSKQQGIAHQPLVNDSKFYLAYFQDLLKLQDHFEIQFSDIDFYSIDDENYEKIGRIVRIIENGFLEVKLEEDIVIVPKNLEKSTILLLENLNGKDKFESFLDEEEYIEIHNQNLNLGKKKIEVHKPTVLNLKDIQDEKFEYIRIRSNSNSAKIYYFQDNLASP
jgi:NAD-dependent SIR2 family protein deacetylase